MALLGSLGMALSGDSPEVYAVIFWLVVFGFSAKYATSKKSVK